MKGSADHYEQQALDTLAAAYTSGVNEEYNLRAAQVYATLAQAAAIDDMLDMVRASGLPVEIVSGGGS